MGALTLTDNAALNFGGSGTANGTMSFGGTTAFNPAAFTLSVLNYDGKTGGSPGVDGTNDRLIFASDQAANLGRERGRASPIPVSPAMAILAGRNDPSTKLCATISEETAPRTMPTIPYWTSRDPVAPAIAPTTTSSNAIQTAAAPAVRTTAPRVQA